MPFPSVSQYHILRQLGVGGMGEVYLAEDKRLDRKVALKILPADVARDAGRRQRFITEAKAASALNHPNICIIHQVGETEDGRPYIAMEYLEGSTLDIHLLQEGPRSPEEVVSIAVQMADALHAAHAKGIVHRDIKPSNISLTERGRVKLLDFGLAKRLPELPGSDVDATTLLQTQPGQVLGTPRYMSPEQALGREVDTRADIFSLGVVLYELSTGKSPFAGTSLAGTLDRILHVHPEPMAQLNAKVPSELQRIVGKCLRKQASQRYQSMEDLLLDLRNLERGLTASTPESAMTRFEPSGPLVPGQTGPASPETPRGSSFGSFEIAQEVYSDLDYTVYSARRSGDLKTQYAVKVFRIGRTGFDTETRTELEPLLGPIKRFRADAIEVQKKGAAASAFITPVLETGYDVRGAWYATRFYPLLVNQIIDGKVALTRDALHHLIRSIAQGALDLKRACGRSHGEIRPANIQISNSEKLSEADVVLSDPLSGGQAEASRYEISDLNAIGRILLQLASQRPISREADFVLLPILSSPEWKGLFGKDCDEWLSLCNRLLDPNLSLEQITLEQLVEELEQLGSRPSFSRNTIIAVVVVLALLVVVAPFAVMYFERGNLSVTTNPPGAEIQLEDHGRLQSLGKTALDKTPLSVKRLAKGRYTLRAEYPGLVGQTNEVLIEDGKRRTNHFTFPYSVVRITSSPAHADVLLDNKKLGVTPYTSPFLALTPQQTYVLLLSNHQPAMVAVAVPSNWQTNSVHANLIEIEAGTTLVDFDSNPKGVKITENGVDLCTTPQQITLKIGRHKIEAQFEDWPPENREIEVVRGNNPVQRIDLPFGEASFTSEPTAADLLIAGKRVRTPYVHRQKPGMVNYRVEMADYDPQNGSTNLADGATIPVSLLLQPKHVGILLRSDPPGAQFYVAEGPLKGTNDLYALRWGPHSITAKFQSLPGLPELEPRTEFIVVDKDGKTARKFELKYGTIDITTVEPNVRLLYQGQFITNLPVRLLLRADFPHDFVIEYGPDFRTNLSISVASGIRRPFGISLPIGRKSQPGPHWRNSLGMEFMPVPGTEVLFCIWETRRMDYEAYARANPNVNQEWRNPPDHEGVALPLGPTHPVVNVCWDDARGFCRWLTEKEHANDFLPPDRYYRLPSDLEWSTAVGLPREEGISPKDRDGKISDLYPWGKDWPPPERAGNYGYRDGYVTTAPVGSFLTNKWGIYDLGGNVCEWCGEDWYDSKQRDRVLRGGAWNNRLYAKAKYLLSSSRLSAPPDDRLDIFGFRVVLANGRER